MCNPLTETQCFDKFTPRKKRKKENIKINQITPVILEKNNFIKTPSIIITIIIILTYCPG